VHDFKYNVHKNTEVSVLPIQCARQTFMRNIDEKVSKYRAEVRCVSFILDLFNNNFSSLDYSTE
jgi:hypothetical protein